MIILFLFSSFYGFSQNVGINATGTAPNTNAGLDVDFADKGVLVPRVALTSTTSFAPLSAHVAGMVVYNTATTGNVTPGFYYNNGTVWIPSFPTGTAVGNLLYWDGSAWVMVPVGTPGQYLQLNGSQLPYWAAGPIYATISTTAATAITGISATTGGNITSDGGLSIITRGICYATTPNPTITNTIIVASPATGIGSYTSNLTGLTPVTTYYVRAYATNSNVTSYGNQVVITTLPVLPTLAATTAASSITTNSATSGGNITADGGATVTERGICYATTTNPTTSNTKVIDPGTGIGTFVSNLTGLTGYTTYYIRSYATNSAGTAYGAQVSFTTLRTLPTLTTVAATGITGAVAVSGGSMTWNGGGYSNYQDYGVEYSTSATFATSTKVPTNSSNGAVNIAVPIGPWVTNLTGLTANTTYYIRSYLNLYPTGIGPWIYAYGNVLSFTTIAPTAPVVASTSAVTVTSANNATSGGTITSDGGSPITAKGVCWSTSASPVLGAGNFTSDGTGTTTFTSSITGLIATTTYYLRAYATNSVGTSYGPTDLTFTTWVQAPFTLYQNTGYGVVMYVAPDGTGFIVSPDIPLAGAGWGCSGTSIAVGTALGTGKANTDLILATCADRPIAASIARAYNGGGYNDWYLPSNDEFAKMAAYPSYIWANLTTSTNDYYTSSQSSATYAGGYFQNAGGQPYYMGAAKAPGGAYVYNIRAIRDFAPPVAPTVTTAATSAITGTTATSGGNVTFDGGATITDRGVCWSTTTGPTTANSKTSDGAASGAFVSSITGLSLNTTYYVRAYATNNKGTSYGAETSFTTLNIPTVTTTAASTIAVTTANSGGNVTVDGGAAVTARGVCWSTTTGPTTANSTSSNGTGTGVFTSTMTGLTLGTTYYVRAYATNSEGTAYGNEISFTTLGIPTVTTTAMSLITTTTATSGGTITTNGGSVVTVHGICWGTTTGPTTALATKTVVNNSTTPFSGNLTGLTSGVTYYVRAYATNQYGTGYGNEISFTTLAIPTLTTSPVTATPPTTAASGGNITSDGGATVTSRGVCWRTTTGPTIALSTKTSNGTGTGTFTSAITGLVSGTTYYLRAFATNSVGTAYGNEIVFIEGGLATVSTTAISSIAANTASTGGTVNSDGGSSVTVRGVCWSTVTTPTIALATKTNDGTGTGTFVSSITGLASSTLYYVRAYATNTTGTVYGTQVSFTTLATSAPTVTTTAITAIGTTVATSGGNVTANGNSAVTARGVCWSTTINPTIANSLTSDGTGNGAYASSITGLTPGTTYYVRAYATNGIGTSYGTQLSFAAIGLPPTVTTDPVTSPTSTGGTSGGNITSDGGATVSARGVCWSTNPSPTIADSKTTNGTGTGVFVSSITGLTPGFTYYIRAYATNSGGTGYGNEEIYVPIGPPTVTTLALNYVALDPTATSGVYVTSDGGDPLTALGIVWGTTSGPTVASHVGITTEDPNLGWYQSSTMTGIVQGTTYHIRAYATNGQGTSYGAEIVFTPGVLGLATTTTGIVANKVGSIAEIETNILSDGGDPVTQSGICWGTTLNPTIVSNPNMTVEYVPLGQNFSWMSNLVIGTTYHVRAYATNTSGTAYGNDVSFVATAATLNQQITGGWTSAVVFSVDGTGLHGLLAQTWAYGIDTDWGCANSTVGTSLAMGTGSANTIAINNNVTTNACPTTSVYGANAPYYASTGYGTDWYLPSKAELDLLYTTRLATGMDPAFSGASPTTTFWSSSESSATNAWYLNYTTGLWVSGAKTSLQNFFAIRSF